MLIWNWNLEGWTATFYFGHGARLLMPGVVLGVPDGQHSRRMFVVSDEHVAKLYLRAVLDESKAIGFEADSEVIPAGDQSKSLAIMERIYERLARMEMGRDGAILALGGGVVSDVAGFAAATWMRGIRWIACPTSLEAMIDAAIGGKTGINLPQGKNLVGAFHPPAAVVIDPDCLETLDPRDLRAGLAESVKHALINGAEFLAFHEQNIEAVLRLEAEPTSELIWRNVRIKADVVTSDPRETTGRRAVLNLGHTVGHAVEQRCGYALRHGECVAIGLVAACRLSNAAGLLETSVTGRVETLLSRIGLPTQLDRSLAPAAILETMRLDKKAAEGRVRFVLLEGIGRTVLRDDIDVTQVRDVLDSMRA